MIDAALMERLRALDSCAVSDALDQLGLAPAVSGLRPLTSRRRICGPVVTVSLVAGTAPPGLPARHLCTHAIELAEPGAIIVVEQRTGIDAAGWGGILSNAASARNLGGVIVEGPARDIDEAIELDFPIYARSQTCRTARSRIHESATGEPVLVGDMTVETGDFVVADSSGTAFIKARDLVEVISSAEAIASREALMTHKVRCGAAVTQVMGASYENMLSGGAQ